MTRKGPTRRTSSVTRESCSLTGRHQGQSGRTYVATDGSVATDRSAAMRVVSSGASQDFSYSFVFWGYKRRSRLRVWGWAGARHVTAGDRPQTLAAEVRSRLCDVDCDLATLHVSLYPQP